MKFDTIVIGGGLSGLVTAISLARSGERVAVVSTGQSALHFGSGSFELLSSVENPAEAIPGLPAEHPYSRIGAKATLEYAEKVPELFESAGIHLYGKGTKANHKHLSPLGKIKNAWLSLPDLLTFDTCDDLKGQRAEIIHLKGFTDFYPDYIAIGLRNLGVTARANAITLPEFESLRKNSTEMRATNMARVLVGDAIDRLAVELNKAIQPTTDFVIMPAIVGLNNDEPLQRLRKQIKCPIYFIPTIPTTVPGVRMQLQLVDYFESLGGTFMLGDTVTDGTFDDNGALTSLSTNNLGENALSARNYVLATGSFFSRGLMSNFDKVYEPVFDLKVNYNEQRSQWYAADSYQPQPYMKFGVVSDSNFRVERRESGAVVPNLYAAGSILGGCNPLADGCGAGVAIITAMHVASKIIESNGVQQA